jgi:signal transduction histidine kinase
MDGVMKLPDSCERLIHLTVANQKGFLRIMVENRFDGDVELQDGMPKTTKGNTAFHGFGVKSMKSIAEKYGGSMRISTENGWFRVGILIPRP